MSYKGAHDQMMLFMLLSVSLRLRSICSAELTGCGLLLTDRYVGGIKSSYLTPGKNMIK